MADPQQNQQTSFGQIPPQPFYQNKVNSISLPYFTLNSSMMKTFSSTGNSSISIKCYTKLQDEPTNNVAAFILLPLQRASLAQEYILKSCLLVDN